MLGPDDGTCLCGPTHSNSRRAGRDMPNSYIHRALTQVACRAWTANRGARRSVRRREHDTVKCARRLVTALIRKVRALVLGVLGSHLSLILGVLGRVFGPHLVFVLAVHLSLNLRIQAIEHSLAACP